MPDKLPKTVRLKEMCTALCLPPGKSVLPVGAVGELWEERGLYVFNHYPGYSSAIPARFVRISDKFEAIEDEPVKCDQS